MRLLEDTPMDLKEEQLGLRSAIIRALRSISCKQDYIYTLWAVPDRPQKSQILSHFSFPDQSISLCGSCPCIENRPAPHN